jgi:6-phosphogluconolactonase
VQPEIRILDDPAAEAAQRLASAGGQLVVTGGSSPRGAYERAAAARDDWSGVEVWFTDERCVPPDHEHSNYGMVRNALFDHARGIEVHRMKGELGPAEGAAEYEREVERVFGEALPRFDLMLLGLGPDAHICSLFPGDAALGERTRRVVGVETPGMAPLLSRITLTLPVVNAGRELLFLVTGEDKAEAVVRSFGDAPDPSAPGSLVRPESGSLTVLLDPPAAARLTAR